MKRLVRICVIALLALAAIANGALAAGILLTREPAPRPLNADRIAKASEPAIVLIQSNYTITTSLPQPKISTATWDALDQQFLDRYYSGAMTWEQVVHAEYQIILSNPDQYFSAGDTATDTWNLFATGTGFFVTEDGYLVTAAHVVTASKAEVRAGMLADTKSAAFVADMRNNIKKNWADQSPTDAQVDNLVGFWQRWIARYVTVDTIDARYYLNSGASVQAGDSMVSTGSRATVVSVDPTVGGHDVAILKADVTGVPALPLATDDPQMGDATYAVGYPRQGYLQESVPLNQTVPIVMTAGKVQRMNSRTGPDGSWTVYGTDAQFTHGDSGGPVLDSKGRVMGVISFIVPDANGNQLPGQGYFVPAAFIHEQLANDSISVHSESRDLTTTYYRALAEGDVQRYKVELNLLESIQARSPWDAYVKDDITHAQSQVLAGNDRTPPDLTVYVLPGAGSAAGVILLALISWLVLAVPLGRKPRDAVSAAPPEPAATTPPALAD